MAQQWPELPLRLWQSTDSHCGVEPGKAGNRKVRRALPPTVSAQSGSIDRPGGYLACDPRNL